MTATSAPREPGKAKSAREPSYEFGRREAEIVARFPSGKRVAVLRGRERAYPGLRSVAPSTLPFYESFAPMIRGKHTIDAGSGSGLGTRILCEYAPHVTALDNDARALEFGREYVPDAEFVQADLCHGSPVDRADAAFLIDVLGHLARPEAALRGLRACLPAGSQLFVAEPKAYGSQRLLPPARGAFSQSSLTRLLLRSGFELEEVAAPGANFVALVALRSADPAIDALVEGHQQAQRNQFKAARAEFARARQSSRIDVQLEAILGEAEAAFAANDGDSAVRCYFEANGLSDSDGRALSGLAHVALATGEVDDALRLSVDALHRDPTDAHAHHVMAVAAEHVSPADAWNSWRIAVNLAPDDLEVATGLARASAARQNYGFAIQVFERLRGYDAALGLQFHVTLAWLLLADNRKNDAAVEARYAAAIAPEDPAVTELQAAISAA
ncbi:MAG TPA: methyltransferase domain-containing protein [Polyangiaceae bacterium]|nr:methyltransferase domain-containing protein [Polyangiaceae bacterium]